MTIHGLLNIVLQVEVNRRANIEAAGQKQVGSGHGIAIAQRHLKLWNNPVHKMRRILDVVKSDELDLLRKGFHLLDDGGSDWPQAGVVCLFAKPQVDIHTQSQHTTEDVILAS